MNIADLASKMSTIAFDDRVHGYGEDVATDYALAIEKDTWLVARGKMSLDEFRAERGVHLARALKAMLYEVTPDTDEVAPVVASTYSVFDVNIGGTYALVLASTPQAAIRRAAEELDVEISELDIPWIVKPNGYLLRVSARIVKTTPRQAGGNLLLT